jgi:hypothetical protein
VPEHVHAELHLEAVLGLAARDGHDAGVAVEQVELVVFVGEPLGEGLDAGETCEVE